ncbi:MAG: DUF1778 domain-containing protein [Actinobacteria bacterium]|nr:DUF1778 domain-containing protein [Actinomycetota bacterium]
MSATTHRTKARTRTQRIEVRLTEADACVIARAATLLNASVSSFVVDAALEKAETVVARADRTIMPAAQFDEMTAALDDPTPVPELVTLVNRPRRITHW